MKNCFLCITSRTIPPRDWTEKQYYTLKKTQVSHLGSQSSVNDKNTEQLTSRLPKLCGQEHRSENLCWLCRTKQMDLLHKPFAQNCFLLEKYTIKVANQPIKLLANCIFEPFKGVHFSLPRKDCLGQDTKISCHDYCSEAKNNCPRKLTSSSFLSHI